MTDESGKSRPSEDDASKDDAPKIAAHESEYEPIPLAEDGAERAEPPLSDRDLTDRDVTDEAEQATTAEERDALLDEVDMSPDVDLPPATSEPDPPIDMPTAAPPPRKALPPTVDLPVAPSSLLDDNIRNWEVLWLACCLIAAVLFRVVMIDQQPLVSDEFTTLISAERPFVESVLSYQDPQPPLYQMLLRGLLERFEASPWVLRGPAVVFGCIAVAIAWWSLRTLFGTLVAAVGTLVVAINPTYIIHSREARAYSLFVLLTLLALTSFYRLVRTGSWVSFAACVVFSALLPYSHYYGVYYLAMMLTYLAADWLLRGPSRQHGPRVAAAYIIALVLTVPAWVLLFRQVFAGVPMAWWLSRPTAITAFDSLGDLMGLRALGVACVIPLLAAVWLTRSYYDPAGRPSWINGRIRLAGWWQARMPMIFAAMWVGFGLFLPVLVSRVWQPTFLAEHALPVLVPMVGLGLLFLARSTRVGLAMLVIVLVGYNLPRAWLFIQPRAGMPEVVQWIGQHTPRGDTVYVADWGRVEDFINPEVRGLAYYGLGDRRVLTVPVRQLEANPRSGDSSMLSAQRAVIVCYASTVNPIIAHLEAMGRPHQWKRFDNLWMVDAEPRQSAGPMEEAPSNTDDVTGAR